MHKNQNRPIAFILTSTNHGSLIVNRFDYKLVGDGGYGVGFSLLNSSSFDQIEVDTALQLLGTRYQNFGKGVVAIDCGANIGVHTIEWAKYMHDWGNVIAFEPQERIYYALTGNITINNCFNARAIYAAVGNANGYINIPQPNYFTASSFGSLEMRPSDNNEFIGQKIDYSENGTQKVDLITLDSLNLNRIDLIKIDIEGMEMEALTGAKQSISLHKPILIIEKIKSDEQSLKNFVSELGYKIFYLGINIVAIHNSDPACNLIK